MILPTKPYIVLLLFLITGLAACNSQTNYTNQTPTKPVVDNETKHIKQLLHSFFETYQVEVNKSDRKIKTYTLHPEAYLKRYFEFLNNPDHTSFSHLHPEFLAELKETLYTCDVDPADLKTARACSEPVLQSPEPVEALKIIAVDAEGDEAVAHAQFANSNMKTVFTLQRINNKWMITERENSHAPKRKASLPIDNWGVYINPKQTTQSYQIFKKNGQLTLEYCVNTDCKLKGIIVGVKPDEQGKALELWDFPTGELVPKWTIKGKQLQVFDYSVQEDKWMETVYELVDAEG